MSTHDVHEQGARSAPALIALVVLLCPLGLSTVSRLASAEMACASALFTDDYRIAIHVGPAIPPCEADEPNPGTPLWAANWLEWVEGIVRRDPDNAQVRGGIWRSSRGGILR